MQAEQPKRLYRFLDRWGLDAIADLELKVTPPNEFNDPFEFTPRFEHRGDQDASKVWENAKRDPLIAANRPDLGMEDVKREHPLKDYDMIWRQRFQNFASRFFGVISLSADPAGTTMWAHYSADHTGLVLELNLNASPFDELTVAAKGNLLRQVDYLPSEKRARHSIHNYEEKLQEILLSCAGEKSPEWTNEAEHRFVVPLGSHHVVARLSEGKIVYLLQITAAAINRIIVGARSSVSFEREVRKAASLRQIPDNRISRARLDLNAFKVIVD